jgi:hypothetical protein
LVFGSASSQISPEEAKGLRGFPYCLVDVFRPGQVFVDGDSKVFPTINYTFNSSMTGATSGAGTGYPSSASEFIPDF